MNVLARVRQLLALATDPATTEEEARTAAVQAARLIVREGIVLSGRPELEPPRPAPKRAPPAPPPPPAKPADFDCKAFWNAWMAGEYDPP